MYFDRDGKGHDCCSHQLTVVSLLSPFLAILEREKASLQEEAEAITEISDPEEAAWSILDRPGAATQWCIVKMGGEGALLCTKAPRREYRQSGVQVRGPFLVLLEKEWQE